jgi:hypothetical protein
MGLFCVNLHFRETNDNAMSAALNRRGVKRYRVLPAKRGWTSLYEERASEQDDRRIRDLAGGLSQDLKATVIAFMVHDSDIACYWLYDNGRLLDEYNSCPNYFDEDDWGDERGAPSGGRPDVLQRYCRAGVTREELAEILATHTLFAEDVVERLAQALGIDPERALADYRNVAGDGPGGGDGSDDEDDGDDPGGGPDVLPFPSGRASQLAGMLGFDPQPAAADPQVTALVQAAAADDTEAVARLLADGVSVDAEAPAPLPGGQPMAGLGKFFPGGPPKIVMTPLLAAVVHKRRRAAERLLDGGADPNRVHPLFGTAVHAAVGAGEVELLRLLLDRGADGSARNAQGQTPLEVVTAGRATRERLAQLQATMQAMGMKLPGIGEQLASVRLPAEGWDACERLLKELASEG